MSKELVGYLSLELTLVGTLSIPKVVPSDATIKPLIATENGVYQEDGVAYSPVTVDVSDNLPFAGGVNF